MSEQPAGAARDEGGQPGARKPGKKILGMSRGQAIGLGVVAVGGIIFLIWRARKNAAAAAASTSTASTCPDGSTPDANGNCPQDSTDFSGALETLQSEIAALQGAGAGGGGSDGSAGTVAGSTGTSTTAPATGTTTTTAPATGATTTAAPKPASAAAAGPIANLRVTSTGTTSFTVAWNAAQGATGGYSYIVRDLASHTQVGSAHTTKATSATVTGLKSGTDYNFGIQALPGGAGNNLHVRTK
jgi:Fibronectin type III domain